MKSEYNLQGRIERYDNGDWNRLNSTMIPPPAASSWLDTDAEDSGTISTGCQRPQRQYRERAAQGRVPENWHSPPLSVRRNRHHHPLDRVEETLQLRTTDLTPDLATLRCSKLALPPTIPATNSLTKIRRSTARSTSSRWTSTDLAGRTCTRVDHRSKPAGWDRSVEAPPCTNRRQTPRST